MVINIYTSYCRVINTQYIAKPSQIYLDNNEIENIQFIDYKYENDYLYIKANDNNYHYNVDIKLVWIYETSEEVTNKQSNNISNTQFDEKTWNMRLIDINDNNRILEETNTDDKFFLTEKISEIDNNLNVNKKEMQYAFKYARILIYSTPIR